MRSRGALRAPCRTTNAGQQWHQSDLSQQRDGMDGHALSPTDLAHSLVGLAFDAHRIRRHLQRAGQRRADAMDMRREFRPLGNDYRVNALDDEARVANEGKGATEQLEAVRVTILWVGIWKMLSDVALPGGTEDRIGDGMTQRIAIRVPLEADR